MFWNPFHVHSLIMNGDREARRLFTWQTCVRLMKHLLLEEEFQKHIPLFSLPLPLQPLTRPGHSMISDSFWWAWRKRGTWEPQVSEGHRDGMWRSSRTPSWDFSGCREPGSSCGPHKVSDHFSVWWITFLLVQELSLCMPVSRPELWLLRIQHWPTLFVSYLPHLTTIPTFYTVHRRGDQRKQKRTELI